MKDLSPDIPFTSIFVVRYSLFLIQKKQDLSPDNHYALCSLSFAQCVAPTELKLVFLFQCYIHVAYFDCLSRLLARPLSTAPMELLLISPFSFLLSPYSLPSAALCPMLSALCFFVNHYIIILFTCHSTETIKRLTTNF